MDKKGFLTAFSGKARDNEILILDDLKLSAPKTKEMAKVIKNFSQIKNALLIMPESNENVKRAGNNLPNLGIININNLNILDVLKYQYVILTKSGIEYLTKKYVTSK